jgi:hypothetical protein
MGDLATVDEMAGSLWEKSEDRIFAVGPVIPFPIDGAAARYSYFVVASAHATGEVHFDQIRGREGLDPDQMRARLIEAISACGKCVIRDCDNEADLVEFREATWPGRELMDEENETDLAERFPNVRKQIEAFVLDRARALASSRIMRPNWREMLEATTDHFASDINILDASATINQAKVRALGPINDAFCMGVLIGRSLSDEEVTQLVATAKLVWEANLPVSHSEISSIAGKTSGKNRRANRPWAPHATELAVHACDSNPQASNETIAGLIADNWKLEKISAPGHRTLSGFVADLRKGHKLPQRTGSLQKGTG